MLQFKFISYLIAQGCQVQRVHKSNTMWIFNKIAGFVSSITCYVCSFFTLEVLQKASEYQPIPDPYKEIEKLLSQNAVEIAKCNESIATLYDAIGKLMTAHLDQDIQIAAIVEALNTSSINQGVIRGHVVNSFDTLSPVILNIRDRLTTIQGQLADQVPINLAPIQTSLQQVVTDQLALTNNVLDGFRLTGESLTRVESINFTERFATIIQNQGTAQTNLKAQVMSTGSELGGLITQLNVNVLSIPSESIAQATEFFIANPALANIVANALV